MTNYLKQMRVAQAAARLAEAEYKAFQDLTMLGFSDEDANGIIQQLDLPGGIKDFRRRWFEGIDKKLSEARATLQRIQSQDFS